MKLVLLTTLAFTAAVEGRLSAPHALLGAEQFSFLASPCYERGCAPEYCYPMYGYPKDLGCYKSGYPKCCTQTKGNCPNDVKNKPGCECLPGACQSNTDTRSERCVRGDGTCKGDTFCKTLGGSCADNSDGRCMVMPAQCDRSLAPVCGCNGATYDNECLASAHGVSVDYQGACGSAPIETNDCTLDGNQCRSNEFCAAAEGQCLLRMAGIPGKCEPLQNMCTMNYDPVCGCDMKTYDNASCASAAGVNVASKGQCERTSCTYYGVSSDTCQANNAFCRIGKGDCRSKVGSQGGFCGIKPEKCTYDYQPVCGCDSKTYANECQARFKGVNVMHDGECNSAPIEVTDCTLDGNQCRSDEFCEADQGQCLLKMAGIPGKCRPLGGACTMSYDPVCGCDMNTYDNANCASAAGVNVASKGRCERTSCTYYGVNSDTCQANNAFCLIGEGNCRSKVGSQGGYCGIKPKQCPYTYQPVCGCDSKTYSNECQARFLGVNVMHNGEC